MVNGDTDTIRVLHVDDDPDLADLTATYLERERDQFAVETATSASEGLDRLASRAFDGVVSDYEMPGQNGIAFLESIREEYPALPFILFTGKGSEEVASDAISAGVTDYLQKGSGTSQYAVLANRVENAVEGYRTRLEQRRRNERQEYQSKALLELTTDDAVIGDDFETALERITETAADVLDVPRVNVWLFNDEGETLQCVDNFDWPSESHDSEMELVAENCPTYVESLESNRSIAVTDTSEDPQTAELADYFEENDVGALLDATIRSEGEVGGVVCHEHVGGSREWTDDETEFANDVADLVHRAYRNRERAERAHELEQIRARFRALTENTTNVVLTIDDESTVQYVNDAVEDVFGYAPDALVGESVQAIIPERFHDDHRAAIARYLREGTRQLDWDWMELPGRRSDGSEVPLGISFGEATVDGEPGFTAIVRDIEDRKERERELVGARRRFDAVFNNPIAFMGLLRPDGTVINVNETALEFIDGSLDEVSGSPFWETPWWDHSSDLQDDLQSWIQRAAAGEVVRYESEHYGPDGAAVTIDGVLHPIRDDQGSVVSVLAAGRDISERKGHEQAINALHGATRDLIGASGEEEIADMITETAAHLLDLPHTGVHLYEEGDDALAPVAWTDTVTETIGEPPSLGEGSLAWDAFTDGDTRVYGDLDARETTHNPDTTIRSELIVPLGQYGVVIVAAESPNALDRNDQQLMEVLCGNATAALDRVTRERLLQQRERELEQKNDRLEEFASVVSHDLRNPLNVAEGRLEFVAEDCDSEHIDAVGAAHDRMETLIEDLLTLAREGDVATDLEPVRLAAVAKRCWPNVETADATLRADTERTIRADESRLRQVFENLIDNAVEHGRDDVTVTVGELDDVSASSEGRSPSDRSSGQRPREDEARGGSTDESVGGFYVEDDGPGIPENERRDVFQAGYSTAAAGTGFGLRIVEQVAEAHGWEIALTEGTDGGARFEFTGVEMGSE